MNTVAEFIKTYGITMNCEQVDSNPNMVDEDIWAQSSTHWKCILKMGRKRMTVHFSQGLAFDGEPEIETVLDCVAIDSSGANTFEDFCADFGYDTDSRKAEKIFKACVKNAKNLRRFLGSEALYNQLVFDTERL